jgi:hypothetical protein
MDGDEQDLLANVDLLFKAAVDVDAQDRGKLNHNISIF